MRKLWGTSTTRHFVARPPTPHVTSVVFVLPLIESSMRWKEIVIKYTNGHTSQASVLSTLAIARVDLKGHEFCCWFAFLNGIRTHSI